MSQPTRQQINEERNKRLMVWAADHLALEKQKRQQFYSEMTLLFTHVTDNELAEFLWEKKLVETVEGGKKAIKRFHDVAHGWLSNTVDDRRN